MSARGAGSGTDGTRKARHATKALQVNLDPVQYGTFAEIGAGQQVAHWFFRVGGAAGTIAKAMSAYDMTFSDAIYGHSDRYVSRSRLQTMLEHEYGLLIERPDGGRVGLLPSGSRPANSYAVARATFSARGPFGPWPVWKVTASPSRSSSNETPLQADWWKKYSLPSGAATKPNPLSLTNRLIVPFKDPMV
jgi:hypothetical protein